MKNLKKVPEVDRNRPLCNRVLNKKLKLWIDF